jgi:arabinose-5-phosphate isomerase
MRRENLPFIDKNASFTELLLRMSEGKLGLVIVGNADHLEGIITDGDLRRALVRNPDTSQLHITEMMTKSPIVVEPEEYINTAEQLMMEKKIATILVGSVKERKIEGVYQIYNG